eukprot:CAMPEP_0197256098 /NCGR_PEP_ID=MMETSP1429-20130617/74214_1 /TAXON_ID=49237 /ORGANISM="Chaetoceros  sp., Strain UNC1202" /LENGTH=157 /DNA_ID=CAMNT_0042719563 /DNA_START=60 /DNA_END=533 /DNA_ORIENTATION=+
MNALIDISPKIAIVVALFLLLFYNFAVVFTYLFKDLYSDGLTSVDYFSTLGRTFCTLLQCTIAGWPDMAREVMSIYHWAWLPIVVWVMVSKIAFMQLGIVILCQSLGRIDSGDDVYYAQASTELPTGGDTARIEAKLNRLAYNIESTIHTERTQKEF